MKQHRTRSDSFGLRDKIGYMMGDFGCNMSFQLVSSYAMIYFTQGMGLTLGSWAVIVVLAKSSMRSTIRSSARWWIDANLRKVANLGRGSFMVPLLSCSPQRYFSLISVRCPMGCALPTA